MVVFALLGSRLGVDLAPFPDFPENVTIIIFSLVGFLFGLIVTPYLSTRPIRIIRRGINEMPIDVMFISLIGLAIGLVMALLMAYPLSLLSAPFGDWVPAGLSVVAGYLGMTIFMIRAREIMTVISERFGMKRGSAAFLAMGARRQLILDTSVLIDGRILEIAQTGFIGGTLVVPRFVLHELQQIADSSDPLRRKRGRRGLDIVKDLKDDPDIPFKIVDDDFDDIQAVDEKLTALAIEMNALLVTNDFNLNRVADAQGVPVLNMNALANAVRTVYIPGEHFHIHVIQEGRENDQGVGYLEDGTMVVIETGKKYMDRTIEVEVTKLINRPAGRMIFAAPTNHHSQSS